MTDRYAHIREALEALDAAGGDWISWEPAFAKYAKASQPDTIRALLDERDALLEALKRILPQYEALLRDCGLASEHTTDQARAALAKGGGHD